MNIFEYVVENSKDFRLERKYVVDSVYGYLFPEIFYKWPFGFRKIYQARVINNLYFDTFDLSFLSDTLNGVIKRFKVRLRWYGSKNSKMIKANFEIKAKDGECVYKFVYKLPLINKSEFINVKRLKLLLEENVPENLKPLICKIQPSLINSYKRYYYSVGTGKGFLRVTVDNNLKSNPQIFKKSFNIDENKGLAKNPKMVIELKYKRENEHIVERLSRFFPMIMQKNSKYAEGLERQFDLI